VKRPYRVLVVDGGYEYIRFLYELGYVGATHPDEADWVLFTGGEDVDPAFYDEPRLQRTFSNPARDQREQVIFNHCVEEGIPMVGICRGGQFLNVMNGGRMWQDVNNHGGNHQMLIADGKKKTKMIEVTSTHHQMMIPTKEGKVLGIGVTADGKPITTNRIAYGREVSGPMDPKEPDIEVVLYEKTRSLCFQPHPEFDFAPKECKEFFDRSVEEHILPFTK
jgi:carbamoylphosphate synthase small subunit